MKVDEGKFVVVSHTNWACTLTLTIANDSGRSIHISGIKAPFLGTEGWAEIVGHSSPSARIRDDGPDAEEFGEVDAIYDVDIDVPPHSEGSVNLAARWRKDGCGGATMTFGSWPAVRFSTLHRTFVRHAEQALILAPNPKGQVAPGCKGRD